MDIFQECSLVRSGGALLLCSLSLSSGSGGLLSTGDLVVLSSDLLEVLVVLLEVSTLGELNEKLSFLGLALLVILLAVHVDGLGSDLLEQGILVSIYQEGIISLQFALKFAI